MDRLVRQKAHRLFIPRRCLGQSSNERAAIEPSVEVVGGRGKTRSHGLWRRIFTSDEGSPHLERHWRFTDGSSALGQCDNREHSEVSRSHNKGRPDHGLSSLRYLTVSVCCVAANVGRGLQEIFECEACSQCDQIVMSALPPKADIRPRDQNVCFGQKRTHAVQQFRPLLDHLVGAGEQRGRDGNSERFGSLEIDHQLELGRLLNRKIGRLCAFENLVNVTRCTPNSVSDSRILGKIGWGWCLCPRARAREPGVPV